MTQIPMLSINPDLFIHSCSNQADARARRDGTFKSHLRFEPFLLGTYALPETLRFDGFKTTLDAILKHHLALCPQFRRKEEVDSENFSFVTTSIATLYADVEALLRSWLGIGIPKVPSGSSEGVPEGKGTDSFPPQLLEDLVAAHREYQAGEPSPEGFRPFGEGKLDAELFSQSFWRLFTERVSKVFGKYGQLVLAYGLWKHRIELPKRATDWRLRPPCGQDYVKQFRLDDRGRFGRDGKGRDGKRDGRGGGRDAGGRGRPPREDEGAEATSARPQRPDRPERADRAQGPGRAERPHHERPRGDGKSSRFAQAPDVPEAHSFPFAPESEAPSRSHDAPSEARRQPAREASQESPTAHEARPPRDSRPPREFAEAREGARPPRHRDRGPREGSEGDRPQANQEMVDRALLEVKGALRRLDKDPELMEVRLKPQNSFIRRQQHSYAVEQGYTSESVGEGRDRGVSIRRSAGGVGGN